jgi:hypothetical protein
VAGGGVSATDGVSGRGAGQRGPEIRREAMASRLAGGDGGGIVPALCLPPV